MLRPESLVGKWHDQLVATNNSSTDAMIKSATVYPPTTFYCSASNAISGAVP